MNAPTQERVHAPTPADVEPAQAVRSVVVRREQIPVESSTPVLDTAMFDHMMRIAKLMASSGLVPQHLNAIRKVDNREVAIEKEEAIANCFLVVNQSVHWKMDPFAVAQHTFVHKGKIGYEGKLIAAVLNTHPAITKRLSYAFSGEALKRKVVVTARTSGDSEDRSIEGTYEQWLTRGKGGDVNESWSKNTDQMLTYRGAREWARRWFPEAILGVWSDEEVEYEYGNPQSTISTETAAQPQRGAAGLREAMAKGAAAAVDVPAAEIPAGAVGKVDHPEKKEFERPAPYPAAEKPQDEPPTKPMGTIEQRDKFIAKMGECGDTSILGLVMDETRMHHWFDLDALALKEAYEKRLAELDAA